MIRVARNIRRQSYPKANQVQREFDREQSGDVAALWVSSLLLEGGHVWIFPDLICAPPARRIRAFGILVPNQVCAKQADGIEVSIDYKDLVFIRRKVIRKDGFQALADELLLVPDQTMMDALNSMAMRSLNRYFVGASATAALQRLSAKGASHPR